MNIVLHSLIMAHSEDLVNNKLLDHLVAELSAPTLAFSCFFIFSSNVESRNGRGTALESKTVTVGLVSNEWHLSPLPFTNQFLVSFAAQRRSWE
jgi:hypothetical protein